MKINTSPLNKLPVSNSDPEVFGPTFWAVLHTHAHKNQYTKEWLDTFTNKIPCPDCQAHFKTFDHPASQNFFMWTVRVHNKVNEKLGKSLIEFSKVKTFYDNNN